MARSISDASRTLIGMISTLSGDATAWMTANCPIPAGALGSRMTAARVTPGAICLSSSSHLPLRLYSNCIKPVVLPPGRARLATKPLPTGSSVIENTIGTVRVACCKAATVEPVEARMTSGVNATSSFADLRRSSAPQRVSIRMFRPSVQPSCCNPCRNAARRAGPSGLSWLMLMSTPMRRTRSACCPCAANGHAAMPPSSVMNSRRFSSGRDADFIARPPHRTVRAAFPHTAPTSGV